MLILKKILNNLLNNISNRKEGFLLEDLYCFLKFVAIVGCIIVLSILGICGTLYIDKINIEDIRYCPNCGHDLSRGI